RPLVESAPRSPIEHYGASKKAAEEVVEAGKVPFTIVRPGGVYGPGDVDYFEVFKMVAGGWNVFFGNRDRLFSAVYVDDVVEGILQAAEHPGATNKGYFLSAGAPVSWQQFHQTVIEVVGRRVRELDLPELLVSIAAFFGELITKLDDKPRLFNRQKAIMGKQEAWTCTADAAAEDFGFAPKVDLMTGVARAYEWYRQEGWL
ncbi:MAG: sugar nucleotide-binding protein, partial [Myxococcales bacterium]|nr:sugar nucleotide-binding protein [Myxococcales bacterium]